MEEGSHVYLNVLVFHFQNILADIRQMANTFQSASPMCDLTVSGCFGVVDILILNPRCSHFFISCLVTVVFPFRYH